MRGAGAMLVLVALAGCGVADEGGASLALALSAELLDRTAELQIAFVRDGSLDCAPARARCAKEAGFSLQPVLNGIGDRPVLQVPFDREAALGGGQQLRAQVIAGRWLLLVEALDSDGRLLANGCQLRVDVRAGATTDVSLSLSAYEGPDCDARFD